MHSWKKMVDLLERVNRPKSLGFQADMAHTLLYILGYNAAEDAILPPEWDWLDPHRLDEAMKTLTQALRPWTIDFHVAQNDATVHGSGTHDKSGHHCLPNDPNGKLSIPNHAGYWLHGEDGRLTKAFRHICWDGCMFPNEVMMKPETWNSILGAMIAVRDAHGWREEQAPAAATTPLPLEVEVRKKRAKTGRPLPWHTYLSAFFFIVSLLTAVGSRWHEDATITLVLMVVLTVVSAVTNRLWNSTGGRRRVLAWICLIIWVCGMGLVYRVTEKMGKLAGHKAGK